MQTDDLLERIEEVRRELHRLIEGSEMVDEEVLAKSRKLDRLLTRYQKRTADQDE